jgi:dTDP-glucose 4,6-dehydratase/UDP-glucuronate decarboxylase
MNKHIKKICDNIFNSLDSSVFKDKTILITGANGLIGGMFSEYFYYLNKFHNLNLRLLLISKSQNSEAERIKYMVDDENIRYFSIDLSSKNNWSFLNDEKINYCFYCAGYATPLKFMKNPMETVNINTNSLFELLSTVSKNNFDSKFIYISSSEIYSSNKSQKHKESDSININIDNKRNFYKLSKMLGEMIINDFIEIGYNAISIRTSVCYGPGVLNDDTRVLSDLIRKGMNNDSIKLIDNGKTTRKYLHISDFCIMILNIINNGKFNVYNISGIEDCSILELAKILGEYLDKNVETTENENLISKYAPKTVNLSLNRYFNEFGKHKFKDTKEGVIEFIEWYRNL